jgi:transcriptional regulator with XRE-family HTH domain
MLAFLGQALREAREAAGLSLREMDHAGTRRGGEGHDPAKLSRIERGDMKRWPADIDSIVRTYAAMCETSDTGLWSRALEMYGREEGRSATQRARRRAQRRSADRRGSEDD